MTRQNRFSFLASLGLLFFALQAHAQLSSASLTGVVSDPSGAVVSGADVTLTEKLTNVVSHAKSNSSGSYTFPTLPPGPYRLTVRAQGFRQSVTEGILLHVEDRVAQNVALQIGSPDQTITVTADSQTINTQDATVGTVVSRQYAANMPLNGRSFQGLISLAPGVGTVAGGANQSGQFVVNGQRPDTSYFTVDGVSANSAAPTGGSVSSAGTGSSPTGSASGGFNTMVSLDALEEFKISTSSFAPEFGRTPGGQISLVTRSGTNAFHGDAFDYFRNTVLDANDWFLNAKSKPRGVVQQNDFGGVFGGRILRNKLFFFASYEGLRLHSPSPAVTVVPTQAARTLAASLNDNGVVGYMAQFLNAYPLPDGNPTTPCTSSTTCIANYTSSFPTTTSFDATSGRVDYTINKRMTLFGRYSHTPSTLLSDNSVVANRLIEGNDTYTAGWTYVITDNLTNDFRFNYTRTSFVNTVLPLNFAGNLGTVFPSGYAQPPATYSADEVGVQISAFPGGVSTFRISPLAASNYSYQKNFTDTLNFSKRSHLLKLGLDIRYLSPSFNQINFNSNYQFATTNSCPGGTPAYICGLASVANIQHNIPQDFQFDEYSFFAQDTWKTTKRLTLTYGVRWEINPAVQYTNGYPGFSVMASSFNLSNMSQLNLNPFGTPAFPTRYGNVSPRVGIAYQASDDAKWGSVVRMGYGVFYDTGNQAFSQASTPYNARCSNLLACTNAPYTGPAQPNVQFPISLANQRYAAPPVVPVPPVFPFALGSENLVDPNFKTPYVHEANLSIEQQLGSKQTLTISYVGAYGRHLIGSYLYPPNQTNPNVLGQGTGCASAPNCGDTAFIIGNYAGSSYNALQTKFQRQFIHGLGMTASYTWSHSLDNSSTNGSAGTFNLPTPAQLAVGRPIGLIYGNSDFDLRHIVAISAVSETSGPGHGIAKEVLGRWSIDPIYHFQTGLPTEIFALSTGTYAGATSLTQHPNLIPGVPIYVDGATCAARYQTLDGVSLCPGGRAVNNAPVTAAMAAAAGCAAPTATNAKGAFCTPLPVGSQAVAGNFGRNIVRSFSLQEFDLSVHRDFPIFRELNLRFQVDMFNVFNHPEFGPIDGAMLDSSFGATTSMANSALGAGNATGSGFNSNFATGGPRNFQLAGKFIF